MSKMQCNSSLFNRVVGQVEVTALQVNFRGSLPRSASNVLEPMLHPALLPSALDESIASALEGLS